VTQQRLCSRRSRSCPYRGIAQPRYGPADAGDNHRYGDRRTAISAAGQANREHSRFTKGTRRDCGRAFQILQASQPFKKPSATCTASNETGSNRSQPREDANRRDRLAGKVQAFDLIGNPKAKRAFAWSYATEGTKRRFVAVRGTASDRAYGRAGVPRRDVQEGAELT
jgi:hypothetical protein